MNYEYQEKEKPELKHHLVTCIFVLLMMVVMAWFVAQVVRPAAPAAMNEELIALQRQVASLQKLVESQQARWEAPPGERELRAWEEGAMTATTALRSVLEERLENVEKSKAGPPGPKGEKGDPGRDTPFNIAETEWKLMKQQLSLLMGDREEFDTLDWLVKDYKEYRGHIVRLVGDVADLKRIVGPGSPDPKTFPPGAKCASLSVQMDRLQELTSSMWADINELKENELKEAVPIEGIADGISSIPSQTLIEMEEDPAVSGCITATTIANEIDSLVSSSDSLEYELKLLWQHIRAMEYFEYGAIPLDKPKAEHDNETTDWKIPLKEKDKMPWDRESWEEIQNTPAPPDPPKEKPCPKKKYKRCNR